MIQYGQQLSKTSVVMLSEVQMGHCVENILIDGNITLSEISIS